MSFDRTSKQNADENRMAGIKMKISYMEETAKTKWKRAQFVDCSSCFELKLGRALLYQQSAHTKG
jgi:hypothetical protein